jgi:hypothetical protein
LSGNRALTLSVLLLLLPGCAIPLYPKCGGWLQGEKKCIDEKTLSIFVPGVTTKDDVIGKIGFPSRLLRDGAVYGYDWETASWLLILAGYTTAVAGVLEKNHVLLIAFDGNGRVVRYVERTGYFFPEGDFPKLEPVPPDNAAER